MFAINKVVNSEEQLVALSLSWRCGGWVQSFEMAEVLEKVLSLYYRKIVSKRVNE